MKNNVFTVQFEGKKVSFFLHLQKYKKYILNKK